MRLRPHLDDLLELRHRARTLGLASHHEVNSTFSGLYASVFRGQGLHFEEVRDYRAGDDIRNMDWKVTARTGEPHLKVFRDERDRGVLLCVDQSPHMSFGTRGTFKSVRAAEAAALLGWAGNAAHDRVGGLLFGDPGTGKRYFRPTMGRRALWRLLHALADSPPATAEGPPAPLADMLGHLDTSLGTGGIVFVIADFNRDIPGLERGLSQLRRHQSLVLVPVDDPADSRIPDMGRVLFRGPDEALLEIDTGNAEAARAYHQAWRKRRDRLSGLCSGLGIALIPISTNTDVHLSLAQGLARRARTRAFL